MKKNMGGIDRIARITVAVVVAILLATGSISGTLGIVLGVVAAVFILTSLIGSCPAYMPFGLTTRKGE